MNRALELATWSERALEDELVAVRHHITEFSSGRYELWWEDCIINELNARFPN
jgi:hypothetical protein